MCKPLVVLFFSLLSCFGGNAGVFPQEAARLNYRLIPFSFPATGENVEYTLQIAAGYFNNEDSFSKSVIDNIVTKQNRLIAEVPRFGQQYTWRVLVSGSHNNPVHFSHFTTSVVPFVDSAKTRLRINVTAEKYKSNYVFVDGSKALYDMQGNPVWYMPDFAGIVGNTASRDLKLSCKQTITALYEGEAFELSYEGNILWKGPDGMHEPRNDTFQMYHHEFTRMSTGHYMLLGMLPVVKPAKDTASVARNRDAAHNRQPGIIKPEVGTIIEYNESGRKVWEWSSASYLNTIDPGMLKKPAVHPQNDAHENSFFFDEKRKCIYVSFRDLSQVIRISYPAGDLLNIYGNATLSGNPFWDTLFCGQHSVSISEDGYLCLFDNGCDLSVQPKALILDQPLNQRDSLREVWQYICPVTITDTSRHAVKGQMVPYTTGGDVLQLRDKDMFISTCTPYNRFFIVSESKNILWEAALEKRNSPLDKWSPLVSFKGSIITRQQLESLIWQGVSDK